MSVTPEQLKAEQRRYESAISVVEDVLTDALCATYKAVTGKEPSEQLRDELYNAIRFNI